MNIDLLEKFYFSLIKSNITLEERAKIANILSATSRKANLIQWEEIIKHADKYSKYLKKLREKGFLQLALPWANQLTEELIKLPFKGYGVQGAGNRTETEFLTNVSELKSVQRLINDKNIFDLVSLYLGAPAHLHTCQAWWQYPMGPDHKASNAQLWHRDRDDLKEIKLFFYATDVCDDSGPHAYIPCSHNMNSLIQVFNNSSLSDLVINGSCNKFVDDEFLCSRGLKASSIKKWIGKSGTCFLEDTSGFHRAYIPNTKPRLIFSLVWTLGGGFRNPL